MAMPMSGVPEAAADMGWRPMSAENVVEGVGAGFGSPAVAEEEPVWFRT